MSNRKLTATSLGQGKNRQDHFWKTVNFCPKCHAHGKRPHYKGCDGEFVQISQDAQIPKKDSSNRIWSFFIRKFVNKEFKIQKQLEIDLDESYRIDYLSPDGRCIR